MQESSTPRANQTLDDDLLQQVSGGCAACQIEIAPPTALDAAAMQGHVRIAEASFAEVASIPHQSFQ